MGNTSNSEDEGKDKLVLLNGGQIGYFGRKYNIVDSLVKAFPGSNPDNNIALEEARRVLKGTNIDEAVLEAGSEIIARTERVMLGTSPIPDSAIEPGNTPPNYKVLVGLGIIGNRNIGPTEPIPDITMLGVIGDDLLNFDINPLNLESNPNNTHPLVGSGGA